MNTKQGQSIGEAASFQGINWESKEWGRGAGWFGIGEALASGESPAGPLLREAQGQRDLAAVQGMVAGLYRRMQANGRAVSPEDLACVSPTAADAVDDALAALGEWRASSAPSVRMVARRKRRAPASELGAVAWAAVVASVAADSLGESVPLHCFEDGGFHPAELQAGLDGRGNPETRSERVHRLLVERARGLNLRAMDGLLMDRLPAVKSGKESGPSRANRRKRARALVKVRRAVRLLVAGERLEAAAVAAGFKGADKTGTAGGKVSPGDRLLQAVKRAGFSVGVLRRGVHSVKLAASPVTRHECGGEVFTLGADEVVNVTATAVEPFPTGYWSASPVGLASFAADAHVCAWERQPRPVQPRRWRIVRELPAGLSPVTRPARAVLARLPNGSSLDVGAAWQAVRALLLRRALA